MSGEAADACCSSYALDHEQQEDADNTKYLGEPLTRKLVEIRLYLVQTRLHRRRPAYAIASSLVTSKRTGGKMWRARKLELR